MPNFGPILICFVKIINESCNFTKMQTNYGIKFKFLNKTKLINNAGNFVQQL